jgi:hypothetical protein
MSLIVVSLLFAVNANAFGVKVKFDGPWWKTYIGSEEFTETHKDFLDNLIASKKYGSGGPLHREWFSRLDDKFDTFNNFEPEDWATWIQVRAQGWKSGSVFRRAGLNRNWFRRHTSPGTPTGDPSVPTEAATTVPLPAALLLLGSGLTLLTFMTARRR